LLCQVESSSGERFLHVTKLIFICPTTNFYATLVPKTLRILTIDSSNCPSRAIFQISNYGEDEIISMFYACGLHVLCIVPMLVIHPIFRSMMLVQTIMVVSDGMSISWRDFSAVTKLTFIHSVTNFYATSAPKTFLRILTSDFYASNRPSRDMIQILNFRKRRDHLHASIISLTRFYTYMAA
jgi:hypothetical protein